MNIKSCLKSLRLRTLPLSLSGILLGVLLASKYTDIEILVVVFLVLTTISLQILSNLSNELGDTLKGTDREDRQGLTYSLQNGEMTISDMERLIKLFVVLSLVFGAIMIWLSFDTILGIMPIIFIILGVCAIWAAMHYTLGDNPYGYRGLGDLFVFIFFGLATVLGGYFLCTHTLLPIKIILPACTIGCFSVAVLNINNIRDIKSDMATRVTVAIKMGESRAKKYQITLIALGWLFMAIYTFLLPLNILHFCYFLTFPLFIKHLKGVIKLHDKDLDPMLPLLVISTFLFAILSGIGFLF